VSQGCVRWRDRMFRIGQTYEYVRMVFNITSLWRPHRESIGRAH